MRGRPCGICVQPGEPHHVRKIRWGSGTSTKSHDYYTVSRCRTHHSVMYDDGAEFENIENLMKYISQLGKF